MKIFQGLLVPHLVGLRSFLNDQSLALCTLKIGSVLTHSSEEILGLALKALQSIHDCGVTHGDLENSHNIFWCTKKKRVAFVDFGRCHLKEFDDLSEFDWSGYCAQDEIDLENTLGMLPSADDS